MAGGRQTPRQKMINLMYLVFIAMMAINIDREVLRSFEGVNKSLLTASDEAYKTNKLFLDNIKEKGEKGDINYAAIYPQAQQVSDEAQKTYWAIQDLKNTIAVKEKNYDERDPSPDVNYNSLQNTDASNKILFTSDNKITPEFQKVLDQVTQFKQFLLKDIPKGDVNASARISKLFAFLPGKNGESWAVDKFYGQPMIAVLTNLTTLQANVRTEEGNRLRYLFATKLQQQLDLRDYEAIVSAPKYVAAGESFDATVAFGAYDNTLNGNITLNGRDVPFNGGKGTVRITASGSGIQHLIGTITFKDSDGNPITKKFDQPYEVVANITRSVDGVAVVVADKMNVVYRGVDNPMNAVVAGVDAKTVTLKAASGSLSPSGKGWIYRPGQGSEVVFTVSGRTSSGKPVSMSYPFRIKNVPKAQGQIRDKNNVSIPASSLANQVVTAAIPDFEFPVSFTVTGFKVKVPGVAAVVVSGNSLSAASGVLSKARSGDQVLVFDISATAVGTNQSNISPVVINVQ